MKTNSMAGLAVLALLFCGPPPEAQCIRSRGQCLDAMKPLHELQGFDISGLVRAAEIPDEEVRASAAWYLGRTAWRDVRERRAALEALFKVFEEDEDATVRLFAGASLERMLRGLHIKERRVHGVNHGAALVSVLETHDSNEVRAQAARLLGKTRYTMATSALVSALNDSSSTVWIHAAISLGEGGGVSAMGPLRRKLDSLEPSSQEREWVEGAFHNLLHRVDRRVGGGCYRSQCSLLAAAK